MQSEWICQWICHIWEFKIYTTGRVSKYGVYSGLFFLTFRLNVETYSVNLRVQSEYREIRIKNTYPYLDTFFTQWQAEAFQKAYTYNWDKVFKNGPTKIRGRQPLTNLNWYDLPKQAITSNFLKSASSTNLTWSILEYFFPFETALLFHLPFFAEYFFCGNGLILKI